MTAVSTRSGPVLVDCAGGPMGGALRLLTELDSYLVRRPATPVRVVGRGRQLSPEWLARREFCRAPGRAVSLNNVSFVTTRAQRWVLLRNVLHFLTDDQLRDLPGGLPKHVARSARIVRMFARRADVLVVPTRSMGEHVVSALPEVASRVVVRGHPLSRPHTDEPGRRQPNLLLCPVLFAPFKDMGRRLRIVDQAVDDAARASGADLEVAVTATPSEAAAEGLTDARRLRFVGRQSPAALAEYQATCTVTVCPTRFESFGYPLAEARLAGRPVVAPDLAHAREVAGPALHAYRDGDVDSAAGAVLAALKADCRREQANPFAPDSYFEWLLDQPKGPQ